MHRSQILGPVSQTTKQDPGLPSDLPGLEITLAWRTASSDLRELLGLEEAVFLAAVHLNKEQGSWAEDLCSPDVPDPVRMQEDICSVRSFKSRGAGILGTCERSRSSRRPGCRAQQGLGRGTARPGRGRQKAVAAHCAVALAGSVRKEKEVSE